MARPGISLFILLLLPIGLLYSFSPSDYFYPNETSSNVNYSSFFIDSKSYTLVEIKGEETFLLLNNETPINDSSEIKSILEEHYRKTIYPSDAELSEIYGLFKAFNDSRNTQTRFGPAEKTCRQSIGLEQAARIGLDATTLSGCIQLASLICSLQGSGSGCDVEMLATNTLEYNLNLIALDGAYAAIANAFENITFENIGSQLAVVKSNIPALRSAAGDLDESLLRFPEEGEECDTCIGICPDIPFNYTSLNTGEARVSSLADSVAPIPSLSSLSSKLAENTNERIAYKGNKGLSESYLSEFNKIRNDAFIKNATDAQLVISDQTFNELLSSLLSKENEIKGNINSNNFAGMDDLLGKYRVLTGKVNDSLQNVTRPYRSALAAKKNASSLLIKAEWRLDRSDLALVRKFNSLKKTQESLDYSFAPPLTPAAYGNLTESYSSLANETQELVSSYKTAKDTLVEIGSFLGRNSVGGVFELVNSMYPITFSQRENYAPLVPSLLLLIADFSLISLATTAFIGSVVFFKGFFGRKIILAAWIIIFIGAVVVIGVVSIAFYLLINHASTQATFSDFSSILSDETKTAIVISTSHCSASGMQSISSCASSVKTALEGMNKSVSTYSLSDENCTIDGTPSNKTATKCMEEITDIPIVSLSCSETNKTPSFFVVYSKKAVISGDGAYLKKCDIVQVLE